MNNSGDAEEWNCPAPPPGTFRNSCFLTLAERGEYDAIAGIRIMISTLSVIGTLSIIILAIGKRQAFKSKVHPIFVLSLADFVLALLWIAGSSFWLRRVENRAWCLVVSLITIILECVTINVTLIYAILAHLVLKKAKSGTSNALIIKDSAENNLALDKVWKSSFTVGIYVIAWITPLLIVMAAFGIVVGTDSKIVTHLNNCSCWCLPTYGNVLPMAFARENFTANYTYDISKLLASYGSVISFHYLIVFVLLVFIYHKILKYIKQIRHDNYYEKTHRTYNYDRAAIIDQQSSVRRRISLYVLVFIINGLINFLLSLGVTFYEVFLRLPHKPKTVSEDHATRPARTIFVVVLILQSISVPLQGFLNAIIYGWTRPDFVKSMALLQNADYEEDQDHEPTEHETSPVARSRGRKSNAFSNSAQLYSRRTNLLDEKISQEQPVETLTDTET